MYQLFISTKGPLKELVKQSVLKKGIFERSFKSTCINRGTFEDSQFPIQVPLQVPVYRTL